MSDADKSKGNGATGNGQPPYKELLADNETLRAQNADLTAEVGVLTKRLAAAQKQADDLAARANAPVGAETYVLKTKLTLNDVRYVEGAELPFDPKNPPSEVSGVFIEGVDYVYR